MSRGLSSYPEHQRMTVAMRRAAGQTKGNGYWGAMDFLSKKGQTARNNAVLAGSVISRRDDDNRPPRTRSQKRQNKREKV